MKFNYEDQKFFEGDLVRIAKDLSDDNMGHFPCDQEAIVLNSYADEYPDCSDEDSIKEFAVYLLDDKEYVAWYFEDQLEFIRANAYDRLPDDHLLVQKRRAIEKRNSEMKLCN